MKILIEKYKRLLVLCVDRDNDIGYVLNCKTPIIGREAVLTHAIMFAIKRPEDSDSNALFAAIQVYDRLIKILGEENCEIAVVAGLAEGGVESDMKISAELDEILKSFKPDGVILVSDGPTDEQVLPVISSKVPVVSIRRVVVQQSRSLEETFVLFTNYAKKLINEPRYRKYSLGFPGLFITLYTLLLLTNLVQYAGILFSLLLGIILVYKGFSLDKKLAKISSFSPILLTSTIASLVILLIGIAFGIKNIMSFYIPSIYEAIGFFFLTNIGRTLNVADTIIIGILFLIGGRIADKIVREVTISWKELTLFTFILLFRQILIEASELLVGVGDMVALMYWSLISVTVSTIVASLSLTVMRKVTKQS